ncbi:ATP-binding cassette sub-family A member 13 [Pteronotus mesoamericanus]|uniref:ATP-binding cassette sub-family A member 13 n=1 Tax=Pteronotus mesoamericanus TaxID=1884717 RepID=UPI0023EAEA8B|nr:ATP-binding cassette sub-family A member 13 [Pteronotus parnellii mesoamericanus]
MGPAGRQLGALLWKNWLCRLRNPVLSLAEFLWPCTLFMILMVLRFQEPPRQRDNCYLQPRDLPSRGVFPFVRSLLCNTGAKCRNRSYVGAADHHFRSPGSRTTAGHRGTISDLAFLQDMQDLATEVCDVMDKATHLQRLWVERSKTPGAPDGSNFLTIDLNKTEEVISKLESLHQQPQIWDFLLSLPRLLANTVHAEAGLRGGAPLLQAVVKVLNSTKELLMEKKLHILEDEQMNFLLSFLEFLEKLLLPNPFDSPSGPTETVLNTSHLWINHLKSLEREPSGFDTQKLLESGKEIIGKIQTPEEKKSSYILRLIETILFEINPKLLELWMYGIPKGYRAKLEPLSVLLNFSGPGNESILSKSFNFSQFFHLDWPKSTAAKMDFIHLSETILNSLYEFGFLGLEQVSEALGTAHAVRNVSHLFSALSEPQKQEVSEILTYLYQNIFKDEDSAFLLQIYSSFYQYIYKFLGIESRESLLSSLTQTSKHILDIMEQFNFQNISRAFAFLYETTEFLGRISELSYCQQLLSVFNFLELQAHSLMSTEGPAWGATHAALTGLKQLLVEDEDFRVSLLQYVNQLFQGSAGAPLGSECFAWDNQSTPPVDHSADGGSPLALLWAQFLSNLSAQGSVFSELRALRCLVSWLQAWAEVWASMAQVLEWDVSIFAPLHVGLSQLLDELESDLKISESCQGLFPNHRPARLMLHVLKNLTQGGGFRDWDGFLTLRHLWAALRGALVRVKLLPQDQVERSLFTVETSLRQLEAFPLNTSAGREFLYSLLGVFMELSNTSESRARHVHSINHFLSNNLTDYEVQSENIITDLRETILFLRNVSHDQDLLSCADIFQNITEFIFEHGLYVNTSQRMLHILAMLNSSFFSEDTVSRLKGCIDLVGIIDHLYGASNPRFSQGHLQGILRSFRDMEDKISSTLMLITWLMNTVESGCSLNMSNINCVNIYLKNVTDFLNVILTAVFEKEKVQKFEILLTLLNDSTNQLRMIINNLTRDFEFASPPNWKRFTELILQPIEMSDEIPSKFQNIWLHLIALGKEIQELVKDIFPNILENNFSSKAEMFLNMFTTSPKEKDINRLRDSFFHLASYLAFNLSQDLQNSPKIIPHEILNAVGLGIQLIRDVFNSLVPSVPHNIPEDPGNHQVLKKVISLLLALKKTDIDLLVDELEQIGESLMDFLKNISRPVTDNVGVSLFVGLMEKLADSSHAWNVNHLLRLSRLFPREDVNVVVGLYYALPHAARLLQRVVDHNITEALQDVYDFTVLHGTSISDITKEDFTAVIKTVLDTIALVSDKPSILAEALTCLPVVWCWNHTTSGFQQNTKLEACNGHFYSKVASILDRLHLSPPGEVSQCSNESSQVEVTGKMVCVIHGLVDWTSILLELSEVFHIKISMLKHVRTVQGFWQKVLPFVPPSGNQSNGNISGLCPSGPIKQVALQIIETFKNLNFTEVTSDENILDKLATLNKVLNNKSTEVSLRSISLNLERMIKLLSGNQSLGNNIHSVVSLLMTFLNANLIGGNFEALSSFLKKSEAAYSFEDLWLESEQIMKDLNHELSSRPLVSETNTEIQMINSVALLNITLQLAHFLKNLNSSSSQASETTEGFPSVIKRWLCKYANEEYPRMIQTLFLLTANKSSPDDISLLTKDVTTFLGYLKNISREGNFDVDLLTQLTQQEQPSNFSAVQLLLESFLINSVSNLAVSPSEATWSLSDSDLHIVDLMNHTLTLAKSGKGERMLLPPGSIVESMERLLETFFFLEKESLENKVSLLLKGSHRDTAAEVSFVPKDKILGILKVDQFLTSMKEDRLIDIFSSLKETLYHLIKSLSMLDHGDFYFDHHRGLKLLRDLSNALLNETSPKNKTENNMELLPALSWLLFYANSSGSPSQLRHPLQAAPHLLRAAFVEMANLLGTLLTSPEKKDFHSSYAILQDAVLANLTSLLSVVTNSLPLRDRATFELAKRLLRAAARAGEASRVLEPLLEMSRTLVMLAGASADKSNPDRLLNSTVTLLKLAKKVLGKVAAVSGTRSVPGTRESARFFGALLSILQQGVQSVVKEITALKKVDHLVVENINDLLTPFLDLVFGMIGVKPNISQDSDIFNSSSDIFSYVNQSKDFSDILEEIAEFLTSGKINLGDMEHLLVAISNRTEIFSVDSVNIWEAILDSLIPMNNITNQTDLLHPDPVPTHSLRPHAQEATLFLDEMLSQGSADVGTDLRAVTDLTSTLWKALGKGSWDVSNLLLAFAQHADGLWKALDTVAKASRGVEGHLGGDPSETLVSDSPAVQEATPWQRGDATRSASGGAALLRRQLLLPHPQRVHSSQAWLRPVFESVADTAAGRSVTSENEEQARAEAAPSSPTREPPSLFDSYLKGLIAATEHWQEALTGGRAAGMCEDSWPPAERPAASATLRRARMLVLRALLTFAGLLKPQSGPALGAEEQETHDMAVRSPSRPPALARSHTTGSSSSTAVPPALVGVGDASPGQRPSLAKEVLCAALACRPGGLWRLVALALQGVTALRDLHQELERMLPSSHQLSCEGLSRDLSSALEHLRRGLEQARAQGCACAAVPDGAPRHLRVLAQRLEETLFSGNPVLKFLSNFTVTADVRVKDLMRNVTEVTEALRSVPISAETVASVLDAGLPPSQVLSGALAVALSGRCDEEALRLLLAFPEGEAAARAAAELCGLPGDAVYSLLLSVTRHLDLRGLIYKVLVPAEARGLLSSLLDVVSRLGRLLPKASRVLEYLPQFLHASELTAVLGAPGPYQAPHSDQARGSAFGSFQALMRMVCKEEASFLSTSRLFFHLPGINELMGDDKEKFNIPEGSTPFCLKLYQEILQSPNGALVWSFLKPVLHGQILYTPNSPEVNSVIRKANYTFLFVDKLRTLSETLLRTSSVFQSGGNSQLLGRLQEVLRNRFIRNFIESQLHINVDELTERLQTYGGALGRMLSRGGAARILALGRALVNLSSCVALNRFRGLESVAVLEAAAQELLRKNSLLASVIFHTSSNGSSARADPPRLPPRVTYTIRTSVLYSMRTDLVKNPFWKFHPQSLPADGFQYNYVFAPLQDMIERAIVLEQTGREAAGPATQVQAAPYPCHRSDLFLNNVGFFFPLIMVLTWVVSVASMVRRLVHEREIQLDEYLSMMGVHPATHLLAWFLESAVVVTMGSAALAVVLKASGIFAHSDALVVFFFLLDFGVSVITLSYLLSALFCRAGTAALCGSLLYVASFLPYAVLLVLRGQLSAAAEACLCLLSTTAFGQGVFFITFLEGQEAGVQWGNVDQAPELAGLTFRWVCWVILLDSGLYFVCGWCLSSLTHGAFGRRKPGRSLFPASCGRGACGWAAQGRRGLWAGRLFRSEASGPGGPSPPRRKEEQEGGAPGVALLSVTKQYGLHKAAVRDLTLTFHRGQITALLGPNGAGKSTVLAMLTGLQAPTSGTILIDGRNLHTDLPAVRKELGVCPQRDVLLDRLTVREHLLLFASLKSPQWTWAQRRQHVDATLRDSGLTQHQHKQARALSGGLKRRLSISAALIGSPRTVVLDEPTSGVDPCSRRSIWDVLLKYRQGRTVVLTTHHLDEAAALSDRVAVLRRGRLRGCGPPLCLAEACGRGLQLTLTRQPGIPEADTAEDTACITSLVQTHIPQASLRDSCGPELSYAIPRDASRAGFKGLFQALEQDQHRLRLAGHGLTDTTLEEVFLKLLQESRKQPDAAAEPELEPRSHGPPARASGHRPRQCAQVLGRDRAAVGEFPLGAPPLWGSCPFTPRLRFRSRGRTQRRRRSARAQVRSPCVRLQLRPTRRAVWVALTPQGVQLRVHTQRHRAGNRITVTAPSILPPGLHEKARVSKHFQILGVNTIFDFYPIGGARASALTQGAALLTKRLWHVRRAWGGALADLLLPVVFVALAMALFMVRPLAIDYPPLRLTPGRYEQAETYFFSSDGDDAELVPVLLRAFGDEELLCPDRGAGPESPACWHPVPLLRPGDPASCGCLACPNASTSAPALTSRRGHTLLDLSASRLEELLLLPSDKPRLGGWSFGVRVPDALLEARAAGSERRSLAKVWYSQKGLHALPSYLNHLNNLLLWRLLPPARDWRQHGITLYSHPYGGALLGEDKILESIRHYGVALCIVLGASFLTAAVGSAVVRDRVTGAKWLQHISGLGPGTYWFANFLFDMLFYSASVGLCVVVIVAFGLPAFTFRQNLAATALLLLLFGYAMLPWMYLTSGVFSSAGAAFVSHVSLSFVFGLCTLLMTTMPRLLAIVSGARNLQDTHDTLKWAFTLFPPFCLGQGLVELCYNQIKHDLALSFGADSYVSPFEMSFLGGIFVQLAGQGTALLLLRLLLHGAWVRRCRRRSAVQGTLTPCKDIDVEKEQTRVLRGRTAGDLLVLCNLSKSYWSFSKRSTAVQDVSLGVRRGECFGLLGANGAGKTTTFHVLSGEAAPTAGHAVVRTPTGEDVDLLSAGAAGLRIGYCPQQGALDEHLTGWEHLRYYCRLRGVPAPHVPEVAGDLVRRLGLEAHADQPVATYSGGTKRKLSAALALLGRPDLLLLDEPSSGMDPCSQRLLWDAVRRAAREGCAVVLTSHSMEECEALCTRLAIMVGGSVRCLGSPQHLKNRFGDGCTVRVWVSEEGDACAAVAACLQLHCPGVRFKGRRLNLLEYHVPKTGGCLADLLTVLESNKAALNIKCYSISPATLEQVFIDFATEQQPTPRAAPGPPAAGRQPQQLPV